LIVDFSYGRLMHKMMPMLQMAIAKHETSDCRRLIAERWWSISGSSLLNIADVGCCDNICVWVFIISGTDSVLTHNGCSTCYVHIYVHFHIIKFYRSVRM